MKGILRFFADDILHLNALWLEKLNRDLFQVTPKNLVDFAELVFVFRCKKFWVHMNHSTVPLTLLQTEVAFCSASLRYEFQNSLCGSLFFAVMIHHDEVVEPGGLKCRRVIAEPMHNLLFRHPSAA